MKLLAFLLLWVPLLLCSCTQETEQPRVVQLADEKFGAGEYLEAEKLYERYIREYPEGTLRQDAWNRLLTISQHVRNDSGRSIEILEAMYLEFGDQTGSSVHILETLGQILVSQREMERAAQIYDQLLALEGVEDHKKWSASLKLARVHMAMGSYDQAESVLENGLAMDISQDQQAEGLLQLARIDLRRQEYDQARMDLGRILSMESVREDIYGQAAFFMADVHEQAGSYKEAVSLLQSIRGIYPNPIIIDTRINHLTTLISQDTK